MAHNIPCDDREVFGPTSGHVREYGEFRMRANIFIILHNILPFPESLKIFSFFLFCWKFFRKNQMRE